MDTNEQISPIIERMFLFLEDGEWDKANEYSERVLDVEPKNAYAYLGKLMIEYRVKQKTDLAQCKKDFSQSTNYKHIAQFGEPSLALFGKWNDKYMSKCKSQRRGAKSVRYSNKKSSLITRPLRTNY